MGPVPELGYTVVRDVDHTGDRGGETVMHVSTSCKQKSRFYRNLGWTVNKEAWGILVSVSYNSLSWFGLLLYKVECRILDRKTTDFEIIYSWLQVQALTTPQIVRSQDIFLCPPKSWILIYEIIILVCTSQSCCED